MTNKQTAKLILASSSPRRAQLLTKAKIPFIVAAPSVEETFDPSLTPEENACWIALKKAKAGAKNFPDNLVLAADTVVVLDGVVIGKPADKKDAIETLSRLSGRKHTVLTGVALIHVSKDIRWSHAEKSGVYFKEIDDEMIKAYVTTGEPMDKAGAYAIQGGAKDWVDRYEGSFTNIIGLPMEPVTKIIKSFGLDFT